MEESLTGMGWFVGIDSFQIHWHLWMHEIFRGLHTARLLQLRKWSSDA